MPIVRSLLSIAETGPTTQLTAGFDGRMDPKLKMQHVQGGISPLSGTTTYL